MLNALDRSSTALARRSHAGGPDPAASLPWPARLDPRDGWCGSPELVSLYGTPAWEALDRDAQQRLAFQETLAFFEANVHGERSLLAALSPWLGRGQRPRDAYLFHLVEEEARHTRVFARFCHQYGAGVGPPRRLALGTPPPEQAELLAFAQVLIFEELVDAHDRPQARDSSLVPIVRAIHAYHHADEVRHRAFGRAVVAELAATHKGRLSRESWSALQGGLAGFLRLCWQELSGPRAYSAAGLDDPLALTRLAATHPAPRARRARLERSIRRFLNTHDLLPPTTP